MPEQNVGMIGLAFACGVLATVGVLHVAGPSNDAQFLASASVIAARPTVAQAPSTPLPYASAPYEAYQPTYDVAEYVCCFD